MRPTQIFRIWVLALVLLAVAGAQAAGPWYVATNGADSNAGTSWAVPYLTISNALFNASASPSASNDTIWVSNGTYVITATVSNPAAKRCLIRAWSTNPVDTVLLGHGSNPAPDNLNFRGVWMSGAGSLLQGFTVTNFIIPMKIPAPVCIAARGSSQIALSPVISWAGPRAVQMELPHISPPMAAAYICWAPVC